MSMPTTRRSFVGGAAIASLALLAPEGAALVHRRDDGPPQVSPEARLRELGLELPPAPRPVATYVPFVVVGDLLYLAGHTPRLGDGSPGFVGKVGADLSVEEGREAARFVGLNILATLRSAAGSLDRVARLVRTFGMVNATPDFSQQPQVMNGFSDLMSDVFGPEAGLGTRAAVGMGSLPGGMAVEIETFWQLRG